jgi:hypothetical protein
MLDEGTTKDENGTELPTLPLPSQRGGGGWFIYVLNA